MAKLAVKNLENIRHMVLILDYSKMGGENVTELSQEIKTMTGLGDQQEQQISEEVALVLEKMMQGGGLTDQEKALLVNPVEAGAIVSIKSQRVVSHRYIKEISRPNIGKGKKPVQRRRLEPAKKAGRTNLYLLGDVYNLKPVAVHPGHTGGSQPQEDSSFSEAA